MKKKPIPKMVKHFGRNWRSKVKKSQRLLLEHFLVEHPIKNELVYTTWRYRQQQQAVIVLWNFTTRELGAVHAVKLFLKLEKQSLLKSGFISTSKPKKDTSGSKVKNSLD